MSTTGIHNTETCDCGQCCWADAQESAIATDIAIDAVLASLAPTPTFERDWELAPRTFKRIVEQRDAEYWWYRGRLAEREAMTATTNNDLHEMVRVAQERLR